jgi:hypothetical protein
MMVVMMMMMMMMMMMINKVRQYLHGRHMKFLRIIFAFFQINKKNLSEER